MKTDVKDHIDYGSKKLFKEKFLDRFGIDEYYFPDNEFSRYDLAFKTKRLKSGEQIMCLVELKVRRCDSTTYPDTLLEKKKFDIMNELAKQVTVKKGIKCIPFYCAMFNDCYYLFRLDNIKYNVNIISCARTTDFNDKRRRAKEVIYMDFKNVTKYDY